VTALALSTPDAQKLAGILGMLGSAHAGERDAAAMAADKLVRERGLTWPIVLGIEPAADISEPTDTEMIRACRDHIRFLDDWSQDFIENIARQVARGRRLSLKQRAVLLRTYRVVRQRGGPS
jgi:hypothetical protein